jgi:hypothetical protein
LTKVDDLLARDAEAFRDFQIAYWKPAPQVRELIGRDSNQFRDPSHRRDTCRRQQPNCRVVLGIAQIQQQRGPLRLREIRNPTP